jgi:uncharacterized paraquat-inducible protein A
MPYDDHEDEPDEEDDGDETVPCPYCGAAVYEDAERCPRCENYLSREDAPSQVPLWVKLTALVCLAMAVGWAIRSC